MAAMKRPADWQTCEHEYFDTEYGTYCLRCHAQEEPDFRTGDTMTADSPAPHDETSAACPPTCRCHRYPCRVCNHADCGWCPQCHPEVPEWD